MKLTEEQKKKISDEIFSFIKKGGLIQQDYFPILIKLERPELLILEDEFWELLEKRLKAFTGKKPQWTKISENGKTWVGMTILYGVPRNSLIAHNLEYLFVVVIP
ncbi:MAG: hypothetical protein ACK5W9_03685 [Bdellovibrionales bacterium]